MKVGDLVWAKYPLSPGLTDKPGIIVKKQPMFKVGYRYQVMFPAIGLCWIKFAFNLIPFEEGWIVN